MDEDAQHFRWGHININVRDLDRSIAFYKTLGFEIMIPAIPYLGLDHSETHSPVPSGAAAALGLPGDPRGRACIMQLGDGFPKIDLTELSGLDQSSPLTNSDLGLVRFCLGTEDLQGEVQRLTEAGIEFLSAPQSGHADLADIAVCKDPDGTLIELIQIYPERWQALLGG